MTGLIRRDPFEVPMMRLFNQFFNDPFFAETPRTIAAVEEGNLALDISEDDKNVIVRASMPGFAKDDIEVEIHDGVLSIKGTRTEETEIKGEHFYRKERRTGAVSRRVALPATVAEGKTQAELKDGVLTLRLAKEPKATPTKVRIN